MAEPWLDDPITTPVSEPWLGDPVKRSAPELPEAATQYVPEEEMFSGESYQDQPSHFDILQERGVVIDRPLSVEVRAKSSFALDRGDAIRRQISHPGYTPHIYEDEETGELLYELPEGGFATVNARGPDMGDLGELSGPAVVLGGEAGGATGGFFTPVPGGAFAGGVGGAFAGEFKRLDMGREMGVHDLTDEQIAWEAAKAAGLAAAGGIAASTLGHIIKFAANYFGGRFVPQHFIDLVEKELGPESVRGLRAIDEVNETIASTGKKLEPTTGEALNDPTVLSQQAIAKQTPTSKAHKPLHARAIAQNEATEEYMEQVLASQGEGDAYQAGRGIQGAAGRQTGQAARDIEKDYLTAEGQAQSAADEVTSRAGRAEDVAAPVRQAAKEQSDRMRGEARAAYDAIRGETQDVEVDVSGIQEVAGELRKQTSGARLRSLAEGDAALLDEAAASSDRTYSYADLAEDISRLKAERRRLTRMGGAESGKTLRTIDRLLDAHEEARTRALQGLPDDVLDRVLKADAAYAEKKDLLHRSVLDKITKRDGGRYHLQDSEVFGAFFRKGALREADDIRTIIADNPEAQHAVKSAIFENYQKEVLEGGISHDAWLKKYDGVWQKFFDHKDRAIINRAGGMEKALKKAERARRNAIASLNKTFNAKLESLEPEQVVEAIWRYRGNIRQARVAFEKNHPEVMRAVKASILGDMRSDIMVRDKSIGRQVISAKKLSDYLEKNGGRMEAMFGPKMVDDLSTLRDALEVVQRDFDRMNFSNTTPAAEALNSIARAYVGIFTTAGRVMTAGLKLHRHRVQDNLADILLDPKKLAKLVELKKYKPGTKAAVHIMGQLGLSSQGNIGQEIDDERQQDDARNQGDGQRPREDFVGWHGGA